MKVGILTYHHPENRNYGAMLQLFASYSTLRKMGHSPIVINYKFGKEETNGLKNKIRNKIIYYLGTLTFEQFSKKYMPEKTRSVDQNTIGVLNNEVDAFLVGSDQVWRYDYVPNINNFFFDFVDNKHKKISYAASFGIDNWDKAPESVIANVKPLISRFDAISVREISGVSICKSLGASAEHVLDPVFLPELSEYQNVMSSDSGWSAPNQPYIAKMLLDNSEQNSKFSQELSKSLRMSVSDLKGREYPFLGRFSKHLYSVPRWLNLLSNSEYVITDSFHCVAFCIIFKKQFICLANPRRGMARLESLLGSLGLSKLLFTNYNNELAYKMLGQKIDYDTVSLKLDQMKEKSLSFLKSNI